MRPDISIFSPLGRSGTRAHGGITTVVCSLAAGLSDLGCAVELLTFSPVDPRTLLPELDERLDLVNLGKGSRLHHFRALHAYLRARRPRVLMAAGHRPNLIAALCKWRLGAAQRVFLSIHNALSPGLAELRPLARGMRRLVLRNIYPRADGHICVSAGVAQDFSACSGIPRENLTVIHNPIVTQASLRLAEAGPEHPWLSPGQPPVILGAGRLTAQKDFATLVHAFALLPMDLGCRLVILGEGVERERLTRLSDELGVAGRVDLPGFVSNPMSYMRRARLFVLSSAWEGFGNVLVEAMAVGTPVVATDCPSGPREILQDGALGRLVAPGDHHALADAIRATLAHPPSADSLRRRAADFRVEVAARHYRDVLIPAEARP